jgi:hypothetical protein
MCSQPVQSRGCGARWALGAGLAIAAAATGTARAAPLCLTNDVAGNTIVLSSVKLKKGKVSPLVGYSGIGTSAGPLSGTSIVNGDGTSLVLALELPRVSVTGSSGSLSVGESTFRMLFVQSDRHLDVGDTSSQGLFGGLSATFTVVACDGAPPIP